MTGEIETASWRFVGQSVCGASHRRRRAPNQDAIAWTAIDGSGLAVAMADGHGSMQSFRSGTGAQLAVEAALGSMQGFLKHCCAREPTAVLAAAEWIPAELVGRWRAAVTEHLAAHPLACGEAALNGNPEGSWRIYGSTVLALLATESYLLCLQLGDGDILVVGESGDVKRPWRRDERLLGVETTSLCGPQAEADLRITVEPVGGSSPALVLMATDGYANSFREEEGFLQTGEDILAIVRSEGIEKVENSLEGWLTEASELGSGDDITVALLSRDHERGRGDGR